MKFFNYDNINSELTLELPEILLVKEFGDLMDNKRLKSKDKGTLKKTCLF